MPRAPTTQDAFNAIAEPRRREILGLLAERRMSVGDIVTRLRWPQPMVSKHLGVLRAVGLVSVEPRSREKIYALNAAPLQAVHEWTRRFEKFWNRHLLNIKARAEAWAATDSSKGQASDDHSKK